MLRAKLEDNARRCLEALLESFNEALRSALAAAERLPAGWTADLLESWPWSGKVAGDVDRHRQPPAGSTASTTGRTH